MTLLPLFGLSRSSNSTTRSEFTSSQKLTFEQDLEFKKTLEAIVCQSFGELTQTTTRIESSLDEFRKTTSKANEKCDQYIQKITSDLNSQKTGDPNRIKNARYMLEIAKNLKDHYFNTSKQLIKLEEMNQNGSFRDYIGSLNSVFKMRMSQLDLVSRKMDMLQDKEDHDLQLLISLHNESLKEQAQKMDHLFKVAKFNAEEEERNFRNKHILKSQKEKEKKDLKNLEKEKKALKEYEKEIKELRHKALSNLS